MDTSNLDSSQTVSSKIAPPGAVSDFQHTPYYCEENMYLLRKKLCEDGISTIYGSDLFVVFISNEQKQTFNSWIPLWHQNASHRADGVIIWDYHVICVQVFLFQKFAVYKCNMAGKPAVVTRVVDGMTDNLRPTRAKATDVANAVLDASQKKNRCLQSLSGLPEEIIRDIILRLPARTLFKHSPVYGPHDLATDTFAVLPLPAFDDADADVNVEVKVLRGCLAVCCERNTHMDIWLMDCCVRKLRTKVARIPFFLHFRDYEFTRPCPLFPSVNGTMLVNYGTNLSLYDPRDPNINHFGNKFEVETITYSESLVSLHSTMVDSVLSGSIYPEIDEHSQVQVVCWDYPMLEPDDIIWLLGSCHGFVCVSLLPNTVMLWNPMIQQSKFLPNSGTDMDYCGLTYGFGYDELLGDYKVVEFFSFDMLESQIKVFSLRANSWTI